MLLWWESLTGLGQFFALLAIPATALLILQTLMLLFGLAGHGDAGLDHDHDFDHSFDGDHSLDGHDHDFNHDHDYDAHHHEHIAHDDGLRIFTVRAVVAFFTIFGWLGVVLTSSGVNSALTIVFSVAAGFAAMLGMAYFFRFAMRLQSSGNVELKNSLGKTATVYIPIPPNRAGKGKIMVIVQGRLTEVDAVTDSDEKLVTGTEVVSVSVSGDNVVCVTPVHK